MGQRPGNRSSEYRAWPAPAPGPPPRPRRPRKTKKKALCSVFVFLFVLCGLLFAFFIFALPSLYRKRLRGSTSLAEGPVLARIQEAAKVILQAIPHHSRRGEDPVKGHCRPRLATWRLRRSRLGKGQAGPNTSAKLLSPAIVLQPHCSQAVGAQ